MEYKASLDLWSKLITLGAIVLFIFIGYKILNSLLAVQSGISIRLTGWVSLIFLVAVLIGAWAFSPKSYTAGIKELVINRPISKIKINLNDIEEIRPVKKGEMGALIRTFGNGGLFGYYGKFHSSVLGNMTFYTTKLNSRILIKTKQGKKIVISPDDSGIIENIILKISSLKQH